MKHGEFGEIGFRELRQAREILGLPERASMRAIKRRYRELMKSYHPDQYQQDHPGQDQPEEILEKSRQVIGAYRTIMAYCERYEYSFADVELKRFQSGEEWWHERFGNEPLWTR